MPPEEEVAKELAEVQLLLARTEEEMAEKPRQLAMGVGGTAAAAALALLLPRQKSRLESRLEEHREQSKIQEQQVQQE